MNVPFRVMIFVLVFFSKTVKCDSFEDVLVSVEDLVYYCFSKNDSPIESKLGYLNEQSYVKEIFTGTMQALSSKNDELVKSMSLYESAMKKKLRTTRIHDELKTIEGGEKAYAIIMSEFEKCMVEGAKKGDEAFRCLDLKIALERYINSSRKLYVAMEVYGRVCSQGNKLSVNGLDS